MMKKAILLVEDNQDVQAFNKPLLEESGYFVVLAMTLFEAQHAIKVAMPDLIVLDIHLPDGNGLNFLAQLREFSNIPVIALTNSITEQDIIHGLSRGCDDYIPKPYTFPLLRARIEARLRAAEQMPDAITCGNMRITFLPKAVFVNGKNVHITGKIFELLMLLIRQEGEVISYDYLYENAWGQPMAKDVRALKKGMSELRKKLDTGNCNYVIHNHRNKGYSFAPS